MGKDRCQIYIGKKFEELGLSFGSHKKLLALCPKCGHEWKSVIKSIINSKEPCPVCRRFETSVWNQEYSNLLKDYLVDKNLIHDYSLCPSSVIYSVEIAQPLQGERLVL